MRYDLKINIDELYAVLQSVRKYRSCLETVSAASGRFLACLERQESKSYAALAQVWNDKILNDEAELDNRLGIMEDMLERYISAMQVYIQPCDSCMDMRVDKSDIRWNIEQMKAAERKLQEICLDVGSSYADYHQSVSPLDPNAEAIRGAEYAEQRRRENNYNKLQNFRDDIAGAFHAEFTDRMSKIYELYEDHIEPFEETDNLFQKEALDYYDAWASASDHFEAAKRVISDVGQAAIAAADDFAKSMDTLAMMTDPTRMLTGVLEAGGKETAERMLGFELGIAQTMTDPVGTIEAIGQSATDTLAEKGLAYGAAYVATDALLGLALDKGLGTLGKRTSGAGKVSDLTGDAASLANKLDDVADSAGDLAHITNEAANVAADVAKYTDDVVEGAIEGGTCKGIYGTDDIANYQYNMIENPGPLAEMPNQPARNFYGGRYNMEVLQEDKIMYRAGNVENPYGRWFTSEPPASVANVRIDTAVRQHWIDPKTGAWEASSYINSVYAIKVPKGTTVYTGPVGPQGGAYMGGYNVMQTYIDAPWNFEVIGKTPLQ